MNKKKQTNLSQADEILTAQGAQALLKIGRTTLWKLTRTEGLPAYRLGPRGRLRFKRSKLIKWLTKRRVRSSRQQ